MELRQRLEHDRFLSTHSYSVPCRAIYSNYLEHVLFLHLARNGGLSLDVSEEGQKLALQYAYLHTLGIFFRRIVWINF